MKRDENTNGGAAVQGMHDAIDAAPPGFVYEMLAENGGDYANRRADGNGMKARGIAGAVIDASIRDTPQIKKLQFPVFSRRRRPFHNDRILSLRRRKRAGDVRGRYSDPGDIITADEDGVVDRSNAHTPQMFSRKPRSWTFRSTPRLPSSRAQVDQGSRCQVRPDRPYWPQLGGVQYPPQDVTKENGHIESWDKHLTPRSLYLTQLLERLCEGAVRNNAARSQIAAE